MIDCRFLCVSVANHTKKIYLCAKLIQANIMRYIYLNPDNTGFKDSKELLKQTILKNSEAVAKALDLSHIHVTNAAILIRWNITPATFFSSPSITTKNPRPTSARLPSWLSSVLFPVFARRDSETLFERPCERRQVAVTAGNGYLVDFSVG